MYNVSTDEGTGNLLPVTAGVREGFVHLHTVSSQPTLVDQVMYRRWTAATAGAAINPSLVSDSKSTKNTVVAEEGQ